MADRCKYQKLQYQVSYNNGSTWENVTPIQVKKGDVIEYMSRDCSEIQTLYRWVDLEGTYICDGNNKYTRQIQEESYDNGISWYASYPTVYQRGTFVGVDEEYCADKFVGNYLVTDNPSGGGGGGHSKPCTLPSGKRGVWDGKHCNYSDPLKVVKCNDSNVLSSSETKYYIDYYLLIEAKIGNCVTSIGERAFYYCSGLTSIDIPNSVTSIGNYAFYGCSSLTSCTIGSGVTSIGNMAFALCTSLTNIVIPNSVTNISSTAFYGCSSLTSITVSSNNTVYDSRNNCNAIIKTSDNELVVGFKNTIIPNSVTSIGERAFYGCSLTSIDIPDSVTSIGNEAFEGSSLTSINIPNSVTSIGNAAFQRCSSLTSVTFGDSVTRIGAHAFSTCRSLKSIDIPTSVTRIEYAAFYDCSSVTSITVNPTIPPYLGEIAFSGTGECLIYVPCESVDVYKSASGWSLIETRVWGLPPCTVHYKIISSYSDGKSYSAYCVNNASITSGDTQPNGYDKTKLRTTELGDCVTSINTFAFIHCSGLTSIDIPDSVTSIGYGAFEYCNALTSCTIGSGVTSIGGWAFGSCNRLTSITLSDSVESIDYRAFSYCTSLTRVEIGSGITSIGVSAFTGTNNLTTLIVHATTPPTAYYPFLNNENFKVTIYVPCESVYLYKTASGWSSYASSIEGIEPCEGDIKLLANYGGSDTYSAFCDSNTVLTTATTRAYSTSYQDMESAEIGDCITSIGNSAFTSCYNLSSVTIANSVTSIGNQAFYNCRSLTSINIPSGVTSFGRYAFYNCSGLTSIEIPDSVTSIGYGAFSDCSGLTSVNIPTSVTSIGDFAFHSCTGLTRLDIPISVTSIGSQAFQYCGSLTSVTVNAVTPPSLGSSTFDSTNNCPIYVPCYSVDAYKTDNRWRWYADRIQAMPTCWQTRWYPSGTTCVGVDKWEQSILQVSYDNGSSWVNVTPTQTSATTLIEVNSEDCGYVPPTTPTKFLAHYSDGTNYSVACGSNSGLTTDTTRAHSTSYTAMTEAFIGDCVKAIDGGAFQNCTSLTSINIPNSVTFIGNSGFKGCTSLTSCTIGSGLTYVGNYTFENCTSLRSIDIPNSVINFYGGAFRNCTSLTNVTIGTGITNITFSSFENCSSLTSVTIPNSVTEIQTNAFSGCTSLTSITIEATTPPTLGNNALYRTNNCPIYVPSDSVNTYKKTSGWSSYASRIQAIP